MHTPLVSAAFYRGYWILWLDALTRGQIRKRFPTFRWSEGGSGEEPQKAEANNFAIFGDLCTSSLVGQGWDEG